ncbi:hypothetical protein Droror1_Dr00007626 [Drosera rotundifolia]
MAISPIDPQIADLSAAISNQSCLQSQLLFFMSDDETRRAAATKFFDLCRYHHPVLLSCRLAETVHLSSHSLARAAAACYLSILFNRSDGGERYVWTVLKPSDQEFVKLKLLDCVRGESNNAAYKQILCAVLELARSDLADGDGWPRLFSFLIERVKNGGNTERVRALEIVGRLAEFGQCLVPHLRELGPGVVQCFRNDFGLGVRLTAFITSVQLLFFLRSDSGHDSGGGLLLLMVRTMVEGLSSGWEPSAEDMKRFVSLARYGPRLTSMGLVSVLGAMMQIGIATEYLEESTWFGAIEFIVALSETGVEFAKMMGNLHGFIHELLSILMRIISDVEDDPNWDNADGPTEFSRRVRYSLNCLSRLSVSLGGNTIVPVALELLPAYLVSPDWKRRHAAMFLLGRIPRGKIMKDNLELLLSELLQSFPDRHPRVRWAAIIHIAKLAVSLKLGVKVPVGVLPALVLAMDDTQNPQVQASAATAVWRFSENAEQQALEPHLDDLVDKLCGLLWNGKLMVRKCALSALASLAQSSKDLFQKHYDSVMPLLKSVLVSVPEESNLALHGKLLDCITTIGEVAGNGKFKDDSMQVIEALLNLQGSRLEADHSTQSIMLRVLPFWLDCLPIRGDLGEAKIVHEQLCSIVESADEAIIGPNHPNLPKIVAIFLEVLHAREDLATEQTASRMVNFLKQMQQTLPASDLAAIMASLQPERRRLLESFLSS